MNPSLNVNSLWFDTRVIVDLCAVYAGESGATNHDAALVQFASRPARIVSVRTPLLDACHVGLFSSFQIGRVSSYSLLILCGSLCLRRTPSLSAVSQSWLISEVAAVS